MEQKYRIPSTQRAYTLRLRSCDPQDASWREKLWKTHEAVNKGAKAFGDWLLTMRGGLDHGLADTKDKRIVLALSWLSVESEKGAPPDYILPHDVDTRSGKRTWKTSDTLMEVLKTRGVSESEIDEWVVYCRASLSADIRDDAVWVNRSKAFDEAIKQIGNSFGRDEIWDFLEPFFSSRNAYLAPIKDEDDEISSVAGDEKARDLVQKAGQWLSSRFGSGRGANFAGMFEVYKKIAEWSANATSSLTGNGTIVSLAVALDGFKPASKDLKGILALISGPGYKSATRNILNKINGSTVVTQADLDKLKDAAVKDSDKCGMKVGNKGRRAYADRILHKVESACGFTYLQPDGPARHSEFAVMLDHAARRVSLAHTWIKRAEAERRQFEEDARKIENVPTDIKDWLDRFCESRSQETGSIEAYRIRKRAVDCWKEIVREWSKQDCGTEAGRIAAARLLQDDQEIDKFGDIQLFEALASDDAVCVWKINDKSDPQPLLDYVAAKDAEAKKRRFKVPAYRHPDPLLHPVFCDFGNSRWDISFAMHEAAKKGKKSVDKHTLSMKLWTGSEVRDVELRWQSKLLDGDLPFPADGDSKALTVPRSSRLSRAAAGAPPKEATVNIAGLFEQKDWNGRLQAPRTQLEELSEYVEEHGWTDRALSMRDCIRWLITFSAKLQPMGPWVEFAQNNNLKANPRYWPHSEENKKRNGMARLILSRLPSLRLLSVDLGHRYAAACAVWETLSSKQMLAAYAVAGMESPKADALYLHLKSPEGNKVTIYRRIGPDTVEEIDKNTGESKEVPHPAPWARLDRQFLIKLQGEEDARKASPAEIDAVLRLEKELGRVGTEERSWKVDELTSETVRMVRLALRRHGDRARLAYNLITAKKLLPGGREESLTEEGRVGLLTDTLVAWHALFTAKKWTDDWTEVKWDEYINPLLNGVPLPQAEEDIMATSKERKKCHDELFKKLKPVAEKLAQNEPLCKKLHVAWATRWREDDESLKKNLRWLRDWTLPRGKSAKDRSIRNVGGLSLTRISTIKSLYQVQKAFYTRFTPEGRRMDDGKPATAGEGFGQSVLDALEKMRENRVKQLASRIAEAALGIGIEQEKINKKDLKRPRERINNPRFAPCHAVVVENLTHYRPEETRTRRENRQLMDWSAAKVKKYLSEACELNGLHLREVHAGYTSRQDSRSGAPGVRCSDVPVADFLESIYWKKKIENAKKNKDNGNLYDRYLLELMEKCSKLTEEQKKNYPALRIPNKGGEIFVSADSNSPACKGLQADLNAAANIGLRPLLDPDWIGKWWYVPCDSKEFKPVADKVKGSAVFQNITALKSIAKKDNQGDSESTSKKKGTKKDKSKEVVNLWHDPPAAFDGKWQTTPEYWNQVQSRVIKNLMNNE